MMKDPRRMKWPLFVLFLCLAWGTISPVSSEPVGTAPEDKRDLGRPIHITSDAVESDHTMGWVEFTGNVKATQEDAVITADRIKIFYRSDGASSTAATTVEKIVSQGNVKILFDHKTKTAVAELAEYTADQQVLVLSGGAPTVWSGENVIHGKKITFFQAEDRTVVEGDEKERVKATFYTQGEGGLIK
jgi:lipopolysaccharide transport protein LptA